MKILLHYNSLAPDDFRVYKNLIVLRLARDVCHEYPNVPADLRCCKTQPLAVTHHGQHLLRQLRQFFVESLHGLARPAKNRIGIVT